MGPVTLGAPLQRREVILPSGLRFPVSEINRWANRYSYPRSDRDLIETLRPAAQLQRHITRAQLLQICRWKSPRSAAKAEINDDPYVREITSVSFSTQSERLRIEALTLLTGVSWPIASTVLHFGDSEEYPILDVRALWSLGIRDEPTAYRFQLWEEYVQECRRIAREAGVSVRTLDKALWQYAKAHQPKQSSIDSL
jgi:hypothetical protein